MRATAIDRALDALLGPPDPSLVPSAEDLARAAAAALVPMPLELQRLYSRANGLALPNGANVFDLDDYEDINGRAQHFAQLPDVAFFGSDGADRWFLIDVGPCVGRAAGAVYAVDRGLLDPDYCRPCGWDLAEFLERAAAGEMPWNDPTILDVATKRMQDTLDAHPQRWDGWPGKSWDELHAASSTLGALPGTLWDLLERTDGLRVVRSGERILHLEEITPVAGTDNGAGLPGALWIGDAPDGTRYALTVLGWRGLGGDRVVAVLPGADPAKAPVIGLLPDLVTAWLDVA